MGRGQNLGEKYRAIKSNAISWGWIFSLGTGLLLAGFAAIFAPFWATLISGAVIASFLGAGGLVTCIHSFTYFNKDWAKFFIRFAPGLAYLGASAMIFAYPMQGLLSLTIIVGMLLMFEGVTTALWSFELKPHFNWGWTLLSGITSIFISAMVLLGLPQSAIWAIGILLGVNFVVSGTATMMYAIWLKEEQDLVPPRQKPKATTPEKPKSVA